MLLLGVLATAGLRLTPVSPAVADGNEAPGAPVAFRSLTAGSGHACALLLTGAVKCWGLNWAGQLGQGDTASRGAGFATMGADLATIDLGTGRTATQVAAGENHSCALLDNGRVKCWGNNYLGQLRGTSTEPVGDAPNEMGNSLPTVNLGTGRTATALAAGGDNTCAILDDGTLRCWGNNLSGQLGQGSGNALIDLGTGRTAVAVAVGGIPVPASGSHVCAILDTGDVKCWGSNGQGKLGLGDTDTRGDGPGEMGDSLPTVDLGSGRTATAISAGVRHSCALLDDGRVKCWGYNAQGQLGLGDTDTRGDGPGEMGDDLPAVDLGSGRTATSISVGEHHSCARLDDASVKCWGSNNQGRLGLGDTTRRGAGPGEMGDDLPAVDLGTGLAAEAVTTGKEHACAVLDDGSIRCWGRNQHGQLGLGDTDSRGDGPGEMGDGLPAVDVAGTGITGTVTGSNGTTVGGAVVAALSTSDYSLEVVDVAASNGTFRMSVPPGDHLLYVIAPTDSYAPGFHGAPTTITVNPGVVTTADPVLSATRGTIAGTVRDATTGNGVGGAWVAALNPTDGTFERGYTALSSGWFSISELSPGEHLLLFLDRTGAHPARFHPNVAQSPSATRLSVSAGSVTNGDATIDGQPTPTTTSSISGTVTRAGSGTSLSGIQVIALRQADFAFIRGTTTDGSGRYTLSVPSGDSYKVGFIDPTARHAMEWYNDRPAQALFSADNVPATQRANASLAALTGNITGTVTWAPSAPVAGVVAMAIGPGGIVGATTTAGDGTYRFADLAPGTYRVVFINPQTSSVMYWQGAATYDSASPLPVTAGATVVADATVS